jgi:hypothetical protein
VSLPDILSDEEDYAEKRAAVLEDELTIHSIPRLKIFVNTYDRFIKNTILL